MSEESNLEDAGQTIQSSKGNQVSSKQTSIEDINVALMYRSLSSQTPAIFQDSIYQYVQMQMKSINKL